MTIDYYDDNAETFFKQTVDVDMSEIYRPFLELLPQKSKVLDAGCGSGRDSLAFKKLGYKVTAFDGSKELAKLSSELINQRVQHLKFEDITFTNEFDGVWACASLLHIPKKEITAVLINLVKSLREKGVFYLSFKYGNLEYYKDGRLFNCYNEESISLLFQQLKNIKTLKRWITSDVRQDRGNEKWLNVLLVKN